MKDSDVAYIIITDEKGQIRAHPTSTRSGGSPASGSPRPRERPDHRDQLPPALAGRHHRLRGAPDVQSRPSGRALPGLQRGIHRGRGEQGAPAGGPRHPRHGLAGDRGRGGAGHPPLPSHLPAGGRHAGHRGRRLQRLPAHHLPRRAGHADPGLQPDGEEPAREGDDQARLLPLRGARGGGGGAQGSRAASAPGERREVTVLFCDVRGFTPCRSGSLPSRWSLSSTTSTRS